MTVDEMTAIVAQRSELTKQVRALRAENAELKKACADASEMLYRGPLKSRIANALSILSTGEKMYLDEYDGGEE